MRLLAALGLLALPALVPDSPQAQPAGEPMRYVHHPPESRLDRRYEYHWEILRTALERTSAKYGPYVLQESDTMPEKRQAFELRHGTGRLTVMYLGTTPELERDLIPVRIPVDKNLGGFSVLLVRTDQVKRFRVVRTPDDLRAFTYGLGLGWVDVDILRRSGFRVVTGSSYDGLFSMLENGRFDAFPRAAVEVLGELEARQEALPDLCIEPGLVLYYPLPMYFWFAKSPEGERLAARAREGMMGMIEDGTYDRIFFRYQQAKIDRLDLRHRRILRIENPFLVPETPLGDRRLWYDPMKDSGGAARARTAAASGARP